MTLAISPKPSQPLKIEADFIVSAASASDFPRDGLAEVALVGRSNVGKSSLINALVRQRVARTSAAPGKTRLANVYRVTRGARRAVLPGGSPGLRICPRPSTERSASGSRRGRASPADARRSSQAEFEAIVRVVFERAPAALLLVDARHPGLASDRAAWQWLARRGRSAPPWWRPRSTSSGAANGSAR